MAGEGFGVGADGEFGTEGKRGLAEWGCGGVVDGNEDAGGVGRG